MTDKSANQATTRMKMMIPGLANLAIDCAKGDLDCAKGNLSPAPWTATPRVLYVGLLLLGQHLLLFLLVDLVLAK